MADVQPEHGYTKIAHEILEAVQHFQFTQNQFKVLIALWRNTYGWNRKECEFSLSFIEKATNLERKRASATLQSLIEANVIIEIEKGSASKTKIVSFNKDYDKWSVKPYKSSGVSTTSGHTATSGELTTTTSGHDATATSGHGATQKRYIKEIINIKEDEEESHLMNRILELLQKSEILEKKDITEFLREDINDVIEKFGFEQPEEMIVEAIKDAARGNGKTWKYVYKKLVDWKKQGIKKLEDLDKDTKEVKGHGAKIYQHRRGTARSPKESQESITGGQVGWLGKHKSI